MAAHTFQEVEGLLAEGEFQDCRPIWHSSNYVYLAQLCVGEATLAAIYKPHRGESPLWDFPDGLYRREVAAYRFAQLLNWPFIPPTILRDGPQGPGSLQLFVPHDPQAHFFVQREDPQLVPQLQRIAVWDALANNADRKGGHCLLDADGRIWGIDHGLCFHEQYKLRSVIWDWSEEPVPSTWLDEVRAMLALVCAHTPRAEPFLSLLSENERQALVVRTETLLREGRFPKPGPNRHYPWPLV